MTDQTTEFIAVRDDKVCARLTVTKDFQAAKGRINSLIEAYPNAEIFVKFKGDKV